MVANQPRKDSFVMSVLSTAAPAEHWQSYQDILFRAAQLPEFKSFAILTAFNPESIVLSCKENRQRQNQLAAELDAAGYVVAPLDCSAPDGNWHEPSLAVATDLTSACEIALRWQQNAIYWVELGQLHLVPVLLGDQGVSRVVMGPWLSYFRIHGSEERSCEMKDLLPDLCDHYEEEVRWLPMVHRDFGGKSVFYGEVVTLRCFEDNSLVREILNEDGTGKVLVIDGHGSLNRALLGDQLALMAIQNNWEGIVVNGAVRDVVTLGELALGVKAISACPFKTEKRQTGDRNVTLTVAHTLVYPGDTLYADPNGILLSKTPLDLSVF